MEPMRRQSSHRTVLRVLLALVALYALRTALVRRKRIV